MAVVQVACAVGAYAFLVPRFGMLGAAGGKLGVAAVFALISLAIMYRWFKAMPRVLDLAKVLAISGLVFWASWAWSTPGWLVVLKGMLLLAGAFMVLWALGAIKASDFRNLLPHKQSTSTMGQ